MAKLPNGMNEFYGRNIDQMPKLLRAGDVPMPVATLMKTRLNQGDEFPDLWNNWFDTSDLVVYPKGNNKEVYFLLTVDNQGQVTNNGRKALDLINPNNLASNYGAKVDKISSLGRKGLIKVNRGDITTGRYLTQDQALDEIAWRILSRHPDEVPKAFAEDESLLKEYEKDVRTRTKDSTNMGVYLEDSLSSENILKAWFVVRLVSRSIVLGWSYLGGDGRFVGIAPEAQSALGKGASNIKTYTIADLQAVDKAIKGLEGTLQSDVLKPFRELRAKL